MGGGGGESGGREGWEWWAANDVLARNLSSISLDSEDNHSDTEHV